MASPSSVVVKTLQPTKATTQFWNAQEKTSYSNLRKISFLSQTTVFERGRRPDFPQRHGGARPDVLVGIIEGGDERRHRRQPDFRQRLDGLPPDFSVGITEGGDERRHGRRPDVSQRRGGARPDVLVGTTEGGDEHRHCLDGRRPDVPQRLGGAPPDFNVVSGSSAQIAAYRGPGVTADRNVSTTVEQREN